MSHVDRVAAGTARPVGPNVLTCRRRASGLEALALRDRDRHAGRVGTDQEHDAGGTGGGAPEHVARLITGTSVRITGAHEGDEEKVRAFYEALGDTSSYFRFFGIRKAIPRGELHHLVHLVPPLGAVRLAWIGDELVGIGELHARPAGTRGEVAFAVSDGHHGEGIATLLLEDLSDVAVSLGLTELTAQTLPGNRAMQLVFRTVGLTEHESTSDGIVEVTLDLTEREGLRRAALERRAAVDVDPT